MKLTVGPLPPSVYWRRRVLVLGGLILLIVLIAYSCSGPKSRTAGSGSSPSPTASQQEIPVDNPSTFPSGFPTGIATVLPPTSSGPSDLPPVTPPSALQGSPSGEPATGANPSLGPGGVPWCADSQIQVRATIASTSASSSKLLYGGTYTLELTVINTSQVTCARDVGGQPEELTVMDGSTVVWDSDQCIADQSKKPHDVRTFKPGNAVSAMPQWNSWYWLKSAGCTTKQSSPAPRGTYTLIGRDGTATSTPITFKIQ